MKIFITPYAERAIKAVLGTVYCTAGVAVRLFFSVHIQAQKGVEEVIWAFYQPLDLSSNALLGDGVEKSVEEMKVNGKQHTNSVLQFCQRWMVSH